MKGYMTVKKSSTTRRIFALGTLITVGLSIVLIWVLLKFKGEIYAAKKNEIIVKAIGSGESLSPLQ